MKRTLVITLLMFISMLSFAQKMDENEEEIKENDVPAAVKTAFQKQYKDAKSVSWEKDYDKYEVEFNYRKTAYAVLYDEQGNVLVTEIEISFKDLPKNALAYLGKNYAKQKVKEAVKITDAKGVITYEAEIKGKDLIFDSAGNFIEEEKD